MDIRYWLTKHEFEQMSRYLEIIRGSIDQRLEEIEASYREDMAQERDDEESYFLEDSYIDEFIETSNDFPRLLLASFVVTWYSFVEQKLLDLCEQLKLRITFGPKDNRSFDKGIRRARTFLLETKDYEIYPQHWQELVEIARLRNFIVHEGTRITGSYIESNEKSIALQSESGNTLYFFVPPSLFKYLNTHNIYDHSGMFIEINPSFEYCDHLVELGKELFGKLYAELK